MTDKQFAKKWKGKSSNKRVSWNLLSFCILVLISLAACHPVTAYPTITATPTAFSCTQSGAVQTLKVGPLGDIGLYLPPCYDRDVNLNYPVLYLMPGFGGTYTEWFDTGIAPMTDGLVQTGKIPPFIIVTTDNTYDTVKPDDIVNILVPYIDSKYRTLADRSHRAIAGGSLGGATAYVLTFQFPGLFSSAGVFGNGLTIGQEAQDEAWLQAIPKDEKPRVFLNSGEQDTHMLQQAQALIPYLDKYGIDHSEIFSPGGHSTTYWLSNFPAYYQWLAEDW